MQEGLRPEAPRITGCSGADPNVRVVGRLRDHSDCLLRNGLIFIACLPVGRILFPSREKEKKSSSITADESLIQHLSKHFCRSSFTSFLFVRDTIDSMFQYYSDAYANLRDSDFMI